MINKNLILDSAEEQLEIKELLSEKEVSFDKYSDKLIKMLGKKYPLYDKSMKKSIKVLYANLIHDLYSKNRDKLFFRTFKCAIIILKHRFLIGTKTS